MNRSKSSNGGLSDQTPREISSPVSAIGASQDVTWKYSDSPVRRDRTTKASDQCQFANTPVRIIKRHASSPLPDSSSKALQQSRKLKTLVEFEQLSDDDSFNFSADFDITEEELMKVMEDADKKAKHERLVNLTSTALPQTTKPLRPKRQLTDEVPVPLPKRMSEPELPRTQITPPKTKAPATSKAYTSIDFDDSYDNAVLSSIPIELLASQPQSSRVEIKFDPERNLSEIVTQPRASTSKASSGSSEKKFFKNRVSQVSQDVPLTMSQKLRKKLCQISNVKQTY